MNEITKNTRVRIKTTAQTRRWVAMQERCDQHRMAGASGVVVMVDDGGFATLTLDGWDKVWTLPCSDLEIASLS